MDFAEEQAQRDNMRAFYQRDRILIPMTGDEIEMLKLASRVGCIVAFTFSFGRRDIYAKVLKLDVITGRLTIGGGSGNSRWVRTFLKKNVKMVTFPMELYEEWKKQG